MKFSPVTAERYGTPDRIWLYDEIADQDNSSSGQKKTWV
jgi:hypothetical protein